jgi:hypothetical protein
MGSMNPQGQAMGAILAAHSPGAGQSAYVYCFHVGCSASERIRDTEQVSDPELRKRFEAMGWSIKPTRCPKHRGPETVKDAHLEG